MTGAGSTATGYQALAANTTANNNTAFGYQTLLANAIGYGGNSANGWQAGKTIVAGSNNTYLGILADATSDFTNSAAIGAYARVNANNKVRIGDANVSVIEGQVAWSLPSDSRLKENIVYSNQLGLDFINLLQTVSHNYIADNCKIRYDGFIAQYY